MIDFTVYQAITESIKKAFHALEARFLHPQTGLLLNYVSSALPTPQEVSMGKPSHMSWNCPIEDGAYYSGLYLCALSDKKILQVIPEAKKAAIRIACGLISLSETGGVPGFIARNFVGAEKAHYQCGSEDQTFPWFYGLYHFYKSDIPDHVLRTSCHAALTRVAQALHAHSYRIPCSTAQFGYKGDFSSGEINNVAKLLFLQLMMYDLTGESIWRKRYFDALTEVPPGKTVSRFDLLKQGVNYPKYDGISVFYCIPTGEGAANVFSENIKITTYPFFTMAMASIAMDDIVKLERDLRIREPIKDALRRDCALCQTHISRGKRYSLSNAPVFSDNWRVMNQLWTKQKNSREAFELAWRQMPVWFEECPCFPYENALVREPLFAAYVSLLSDSEADEAYIEKVCDLLLHYPWEQLSTSTFYMALLVAKQLLHTKYFDL